MVLVLLISHVLLFSRGCIYVVWILFCDVLTHKTLEQKEDVLSV